MESSVKESSAAASSLRKLILMPGLSAWHYRYCRRCLPCSSWSTINEVLRREQVWSVINARPKLPRLRLRYGLPSRRLYIRL